MNDILENHNPRNDLFRDELARTVLNSLSARIAILDQDGILLETNKAWCQFAIKNGMPEEHDAWGTN